MRFVTVESYDGTIKAFTEQGNYAAAINDGDAACWVWQFADTSEQAVKQHAEKHALWEADIKAGHQEKDTY